MSVCTGYETFETLTGSRTYSVCTFQGAFHLDRNCFHGLNRATCCIHVRLLPVQS